MTDRDKTTEALPTDLEERVFEEFFGLPEERHEAALAELVARHPEHAAALTAAFARLRAGDGLFAGLADAGPEPQPTTIGPYKVLSKLGEGGFGVVYLAEQAAPIRRKVAIKCLLPGMDSRRVLARFAAERQALAMMSHRCIAQVFDARSEAGRPFFVMEYVAGVAITDYCDQARLGMRERIGVFLDVCDAVQHAHQKGVIHRDLKPSNILVTEEGGEPVPKIIDFGVAKAIHQPLTMRTLYTEVGRVIGTPEYMSPEQISPTPLDIDTRTDVYSLGVVLYELLAGSLPFSSEAVRKHGLDRASEIIGGVQPDRPSARVATAGDETQASLRATRKGTWVDEIRGDLDWIVLRALEKERHRRYGSAQELAADLRRFLDDEPIEARPPEWTYRARKFVRRNRAKVGVFVVLFVTLVGALVTSIAFHAEAKGHLANYERLSDVVEIQRLQQEAESMWPARPEIVPQLEAWLRRARAVAGRRPAHERVRDEVRARAAATADVAAGAASDAFLLESLERLLAGLDGLTQTLAGVERRLAWAQKVHQVTIEDPAERWRACREDLAKDLRFAGLDLQPQLGLVPISKNPETGLWEFGHPRTGVVPLRRANGQIGIDAGDSLVFVLLPGGKFQMGAQADDPQGVNYAATATPFEKPVTAVEVGPCFFAKFEMTQAQWRRLTGDNPSRFKPTDDSAPAYKVVRETNPVESVDYFAATEQLRRVALLLPTEAQWEYACRAGRGTPWYTGERASSLEGHANIADEGSAKYFHAGSAFEKGLFDGFASHAPVGSFGANDFGLHDMHGNVSEWVQDWFSYYENPPRPGDGLRTGELGKRDLRVLRGGSFSQIANYARSGFRSGAQPKSATWGAGVRPVRRIDRTPE